MAGLFQRKTVFDGVVSEGNQRKRMAPSGVWAKSGHKKGFRSCPRPHHGRCQKAPVATAAKHARGLGWDHPRTYFLCWFPTDLKSVTFAGNKPFVFPWLRQLPPSRRILDASAVCCWLCFEAQVSSTCLEAGNPASEWFPLKAPWKAMGASQNALAFFG